MITFYNIGKLALSDGSYDIAAKWLRRALTSSDTLGHQSDLASKETRLLVLHAVGKHSSRVSYRPVFMVFANNMAY